MSPADLKTIRVRLGMTQGELALALGSTAGSGGRRIRRYEKGEAAIPPAIADKVRNLCQESPQ